MPVELKIPSAGESISNVLIGEWRKREGDTVQRDEPIVEIETDKASMELPSPVSGRITKVLKKSGESAAVGDVIGLVEEGATDGKTATKPAAPPSKKDENGGKTKPAADAKTAPVPPAAKTASAGHIMPAARRILGEAGMSEQPVQGTGPGGRVLKEDAERAASQSRARQEAVAAGPSSPHSASSSHTGDRQEEIVPMTALRRKVAERLVQAQQTAALLTTFNEIDMSAVLALRSEHQDAFLKKYNVKLGFMSFFVKAAIDALKQIPQINAEIRGTDIVYKNYFDIGIAVSGERGLVVPVLRNSERLSFAEIEIAIADFGTRARENKIKLEELQGGTFTISNGGVFGSLMSTPIVNPPQSGVLGLHAIQERPVARNNQVVIRPMMYVALTYDHRIVDGREAVTFLKRIKDAVETPARMLIEA